MVTPLKKISAIAALLVCGPILLYMLRPPGEVPKQPMEPGVPLPEAWLDGGALPGITWADDIHPIFVRNKCGNCHTRGQEEVVDGLDRFSLGIIDPENPANPYYSYRELVYPEGSPNMIDGEILRDGQCCWPKGFPIDQQRRIWLGHPERSALLRKLERDYYDWNKPPRFFGEGLRLLWGLPMPLWQEDNERSADDAPTDRQAAGSQSGDSRAIRQDTGKQEHENAGYSTSIWKRMAFKSLLWSGGGRDRLMALPPRIPARDRAMLRYWITNAMQLQDDKIGIRLHMFRQDNMSAVDREIILVGNFTNPGQQEIKEVFRIITDENGEATLNFPAWSVVSRFWYAGTTGMNREDYAKITLGSGIIERRIYEDSSPGNR